MVDITDADYAYGKRVCKDFEIKIIGEYHDLYVQSDALLLADIFANFKNMSLKIYKLDLAETMIKIKNHHILTMQIIGMQIIYMVGQSHKSFR